MSETAPLPDRDEEHEQQLAVVFNMSPSQARALSCLMRVPVGRVVSSNELGGYVDLVSPVKIAVHHIRKKLASSGVKATVSSVHMAGYILHPVDRERVERAVQQYMGGE